MFGLPLQVQGRAPGILLAALEDFLWLPRVPAQDEAAWSISWQDALFAPPLSAGQPIVVARRSTGDSRVWWRVSSPPYERFVNCGDATEVLLDAPGHHLCVAGTEPAEERRGFTLQECLKCLLKGFLVGRGWSVAHAAAVAMAGGGVLLLGRKGAGKSTLKLALLEAGCSFVSADRTFIRSTRSGKACALPWPGAIRLAPASVSLFRPLLEPILLSATTFDSRSGKLRIPFAPFTKAFGSAAPGAQPIRACVIVERDPRGSGWRLDCVKRQRCFEHLFAEASETRPDWLATSRWWPRPASPQPFGRTPVYSLTGDGSPAQAAELILEELSTPS